MSYKYVIEGFNKKKKKYVIEGNIHKKKKRKKLRTNVFVIKNDGMKCEHHQDVGSWWGLKSKFVNKNLIFLPPVTFCSHNSFGGTQQICINSVVRQINN